jgi:hypothetical protein
MPAVAAAQAGAPAGGSGAALLPRAEFAFAWGHLVTPDQRFMWLGELGFDLDIVDFGSGRLRFATEVEGIVGRERRLYDLNHGNYMFDFALSYRPAPHLEVEAIAEHVSRHLIDRDNPPVVSWNLAGARARYEQAGWSGHLDFAWVTQPAAVDYRWISRLRVAHRRRVTPRLSVFATGDGEVVRVDEAARGKSRVCGGRIEGGIRVHGRAAAVELFAGYERRVDAFPLSPFRVRWFTAGFRIVSGP